MFELDLSKPDYQKQDRYTIAGQYVYIYIYKHPPPQNLRLLLLM